MKKILFIILLITSFFAFTSCARHIKDTNGENNFNTETISTQDMLDNNSSSIKQGALEKKKGNSVSINVKKFSGIETIHNFKLNSATLDFAINIKVNSGNLKVIICSKSDVIKEFKVNKGTQRLQLPTTTENLYLKIAGESASFSLSYEYEVNMDKGVVI